MADVVSHMHIPHYSHSCETLRGKNSGPLRLTNTGVSLQEQPPPERKARKSVAFSEGTTIMDENGQISDAAQGGDRTTAESHTNGKSRVWLDTVQ